MVVITINALIDNTITQTFYLSTQVVLKFGIWCATILRRCGGQMLWMHARIGLDHLDDLR